MPAPVVSDFSNPAIVNDRVRIQLEQIVISPTGGSTDDGARLFASGGVAEWAVSSGKPMVLLAGTYTISDNQTVPTGCILRFLPGAVMSIASGKTLTVNGIVDAFPNSAIFSGSGTATLTQANISGKWYSAAGASVFTADAAATSVTYKQADKTTNNSAGASTTIQAQNETGTTSTGGQLILASGTGTTSPGAIKLKDGTTEIGTFSAAGAGDCRFVAGPAVNYFLFAANQASQALFFQSTGAGGSVTFQSSSIRFGDATPTDAIIVTPVANGANIMSVSDSGAAASLDIRYKTTSRIKMDATGIGFFATAPAAKPTVTGSKGANAALTSLMTALAALGLVTDSTS